ncbi:MAG: hypothetical protein DLM70_14120, partial [Chloroflexi bacterium]
VQDPVLIAADFAARLTQFSVNLGSMGIFQWRISLIQSVEQGDVPVNSPLNIRRQLINVLVHWFLTILIAVIYCAHTARHLLYPLFGISDTVDSESTTSMD